MNKTTARRTLVAAHNAPVEITRESRKTLNPALHALGLPTLGAHKTLPAYFAALSGAHKATLKAALGEPKAAPAKKAAWTCSCTTVRDHLSARCTAKAA